MAIVKGENWMKRRDLINTLLFLATLVSLIFAFYLADKEYRNVFLFIAGVVGAIHWIYGKFTNDQIKLDDRDHKNGCE